MFAQCVQFEYNRAHSWEVTDKFLQNVASGCSLSKCPFKGKLKSVSQWH